MANFIKHPEYDHIISLLNMDKVVEFYYYEEFDNYFNEMTYQIVFKFDYKYRTSNGEDSYRTEWFFKTKESCLDFAKKLEAKFNTKL